MDLIELRDIHKTYYLGKVDVPVLKGISLRVAQGELVALMDTSGSGKSTLMTTWAALITPPRASTGWTAKKFPGCRPSSGPG